MWLSQNLHVWHESKLLIHATTLYESERVGRVLFQSSSTEFRYRNRGKTPKLSVDAVPFPLDIRN
jgi:hypothetical protein